MLLHRAATEDNVDLIKYLCDNGADIHACDNVSTFLLDAVKLYNLRYSNSGVHFSE